MIGILALVVPAVLWAGTKSEKLNRLIKALVAQEDETVIVTAEIRQGQLIIKCPNAKEITQKLHRLGAIHHVFSNSWHISETMLSSVRNAMSPHIFTLDGEFPMVGIDENNYPTYSIAPGFSVSEHGNTGFKTAPYGEFQMRGFNALFKSDYLILADDAGLGKTWQSINAIAARKQNRQIQTGLVVCKATLLHNWKNEIMKHSNETCVVVAGTKQQRDKIYKEIALNPPTFMIMSYQILKGDMETLSVLDNTVHLDFCILDEAHMVKSPLSGIGKSIHKLPFKIKWALTATPTPNNPLEWYNYFKWFGLIKTNWHKFNMVHTVRNGYIIWYYRNMDDIQAYCRNFMLKRTKAEKLKELPPMDIREYIIPMSKAHRDVYNTVSQEILEELEELENCTMATQLTKLLRLRQITDHPKMVGSDVASSKLIYLKQLVDDFVSEGRKVVVYSVFQEMVSLMAQELSEYNPAVITGLTQKHGRTKESAERAVKKDHPDAVGMVYDKLLHEYMSSPSQKEVNKFQQDDTCKVFLGTAGACREGLTLTAGTVVISTSSEWSEDYNDQAFSRLHRIGQLETVQVIYLLLEDSVDMYVRQVAIDKTIINKNFTGVHPLIQNILGGRGKVKAPKKENSRKKGL